MPEKDEYITSVDQLTDDQVIDALNSERSLGLPVDHCIPIVTGRSIHISDGEKFTEDLRTRIARLLKEGKIK